MTFEEYADELARIDPSGPNPGVDWARIECLWAEVEEKAERVVASIAPDAVCAAQEWDRRIDCSIMLPDGRVAAEMIRLRDLNDKRLRDCGDRLRRLAAGENVRLVNERPAPVKISPAPFSLWMPLALMAVAVGVLIWLLT